jgi:phage/plasmid-associated DNA primase
MFNPDESGDAAALEQNGTGPVDQPLLLSLEKHYPGDCGGWHCIERDCATEGANALACRLDTVPTLLRDHLEALRARAQRHGWAAPMLEPLGETEAPVAAPAETPDTNAKRPFLVEKQIEQISAALKETSAPRTNNNEDHTPVRAILELPRMAKSDGWITPAPIPAPGFTGLSPKEQLTLHLDFLGLGEDGTEIVLDLDPGGGKGHWMRLATVSRDREATDPSVYVLVHDRLMTARRLEEGKVPSGELLGTRNWLFEVASSGKFEIFFKPNDFRGAGFTVEKQFVLATRVFVAEADGKPLQEQLERLRRLVELGLRVNAVVFSGGKSIHLFIRAPKGMSEDWGRDVRINQKLCVAFNGDHRVVFRERSMRLAGFDRRGGGQQTLLTGTAEEFFATVEELEATLDSMLQGLGINDWEAAHGALVGADLAQDNDSNGGSGANDGEKEQSGVDNPCPVCGRGKSSACTIYVDGDRRRVNCFQGETFSPPKTRDWGSLGGVQPLAKGDTVDGKHEGRWAFVKTARNEGLGGTFSVFVEDRPLERKTGKGGEQTGVLLKKAGKVIDLTTEAGFTISTPKQLTPKDTEEFHLRIEAKFANSVTGSLEEWITVCGNTFKWKGTHFERVPDEILKELITNEARGIVHYENDDNRAVHPFLNSQGIITAFNWIKLVTTKDPALVNPTGYINCRNGVVHIQLDGTKPQVTLEPHAPEKHYFLEEPGFSYDPRADRTHAERLLECVDGEGPRRLLLQVLSGALAIDELRKLGHRIPALLLLGEGENGKDTLRSLLELIFGKAAVASISLSDWRGFDEGQGRGRFNVHQLSGARLAIASENKANLKLDNLEELKKAITGDPLIVEQKNRDPLRIEPKAAFLFFMNKPPLLDGGSAAIRSRYGVINMPYSYSTNPRRGQKQADPRFKFDQEWVAAKVLPALLNIMIEALGESAANGIDLQSCTDAMQTLKEETSHLHSFLRDSTYELGNPEDFVELMAVYQELQEWYKAQGWKTFNSRAAEWVFIEDGDGDKPVKTNRLLPKRLNDLFPSVRRNRSNDPTSRRILLHGLRKKPGVVKMETVPAPPIKSDDQNPWMRKVA